MESIFDRDHKRSMGDITEFKLGVHLYLVPHRFIVIIRIQSILSSRVPVIRIRARLRGQVSCIVQIIEECVQIIDILFQSRGWSVVLVAGCDPLTAGSVLVGLHLVGGQLVGGGVLLVAGRVVVAGVLLHPSVLAFRIHI